MQLRTLKNSPVFIIVFFFFSEERNNDDNNKEKEVEKKSPVYLNHSSMEGKHSESSKMAGVRLPKAKFCPSSY